MLIPGYATAEGTARFRARFEPTLNFRQADGLSISSIGLGTYLGDPTAEVDAGYEAAVIRAAELGVNVLDSAINYRHQRSERAIGRALAMLIGSGRFRRDEFVLATKGGFLSFDGSEPADPAAYFNEKLVRSGLIEPGDVAAGCHAIAPRFLAAQIEASRRNLGVETLDLYYVHNPETQLSAVSREEFYRRLRTAFEALEEAVAQGKIRMYGTATWNAYRVAPESRDAVSLAEVLRAARQAGGENHHFRAIQLPFNLAMLEALASGTQSVDGKFMPALRAAETFGLTVFASATLLESRLAAGLPERIQQKFPGLSTDAQRAIQFVRSAPGVASALVGMSQPAHVEENLRTAAVPPLTPKAFRALFSS